MKIVPFPPAPTALETYTNIHVTGGRLSLVWNLALEIIKKGLPGLIDIANEADGLDLKHPAAYHVSSELLKNEYPRIIIGATVTTVPLAPNVFHDRPAMVVYADFGPHLTRSDIDNASDYVQLIKGALLPYHKGGYTGDPDNGFPPVKVWEAITPTDITPGPGEWDKHKGFCAHYIVTQTPTPGQWPLPAP